MVESSGKLDVECLVRASLQDAPSSLVSNSLVLLNLRKRLQRLFQ